MTNLSRASRICLGIVLLSVANISAQSPHVQVGVISAAEIKYQFFPAADRNYHLFGTAGFGVVARIAGSDEAGLSFQPKLLFVRENISYSHTSAVDYNIESINLVFNPEILFPTRNDRWKISAGIGIDWEVAQDLVVYSNNSIGYSGYPNSAYELIQETRRPLIPFVSAGVLFQIIGGLHTQLSLRQDLRNAFPDNTVAVFNSGQDNLTVSLSHQATRMGLGIIYLFGRRNAD